MENQINVGDQNFQQIGQNSITQQVQIQKKSKINYWIISTVVFFLFLLGASVVYILSNNKSESSNIQPSATEQTQKTANEKAVTNRPTDLFKYIEKIENSKLLNTQLEAWKVEIDTNLLTDKNIKKFRINLFDGHNYEVERNEEQMQNSICDSQKCTWIGYISGRSCMAKNTVTGKCSPGETIIFILNKNTIAGTIPAVVGVNQYVYSVGGMTNDPGPFLFKVDPSKFGPD